MGYYDQTEIGQQNNNNNKKKGSKLGYFLSALVGVIVGALLVWLILPNNTSTTSTSDTASKNVTKTEQVQTEVTTDITGAVDKAAGAVVGITNLQKSQSSEDIFGRQSPFSSGSSSDDEEEQESGSGSGVIYKKEDGKAYIVTNNHVVEDASSLEVTLPDGKKEKAKLVGTDVWTDLAVITIDDKNVETVATFGDSDVLKQGETVIAIGNPLGLDFYGSVTAGIVSGKDRSVPVDLNDDGTEDWQAEVLQTDAAINPGNSGGALVNLTGELVGINSMKISESSIEGIGFSIPINTAIPIIEQLEAKGEVERPSLGISLIDLTNVPTVYQQDVLNLPEDITEGVVVGEVTTGSPADKAGLKKYDTIVEIDGNKITDSISLRKALYSKSVGDDMKLKLYSDGKVTTKTVKLSSTVEAE